MIAETASKPARDPWQPRGAASTLYRLDDPEILLAGPAGTGKSRGCLQYLHDWCRAYPRVRVLIMRKTLTSLTASGLVTYREKVLQPEDRVKFFGGSRERPAQYQYPNGSVIVVGGMDKAAKVMSAEYDLVYCVVGETRIESETPIEKAFIRKYSGPLVTIRTAAGNELTGTPNHPILTRKGWVALGLLSEGDDVISCRFVQDECPGGNPDVQNNPPTIAEIAGALSLSSASRTKRVETVGMDFHGDGGDGYVDIISASSSFHESGDAALVQPVIEGDRVRRDLESHPFVRQSAASKVLIGVGSQGIPSRRVGAKLPESLSVLSGVDPGLPRSHARFSEVLRPFGVDIAKMPLALRLARGSRLQVTASEFGFEGTVTDADGCSDGDEAAFPGKVALDRVVHVERFDQPAGASRHVYNLQTGDHRYVANNIISHNCQEATELTEPEWEALSTRVRNGAIPVQQLIGDCNPDAPTHWLKKRADGGRLVLLESRHEDNPSVTPAYLATLDALTGVRYLRLRLGQWAAAEGLIYEGWDRAQHIVTRTQIHGLVDGQFPATWPRYWAIDFGYTNPFVWQQWVEDTDGRLYLEKEISRTQRIVADHARQIARVTAADPRPRRVICDHDAEDRATLERELSVVTEPAVKAVSPGIQAVAARLRDAGDGRPRLLLLADALVDRDAALEDAHKPIGLAQEFDGYVWDTKQQRKGEVPLKRDDHSCLVAGTLVEADSGPTPIEAIAIGMKVLTRAGYRTVSAAGMTDSAARVLTVRCSDGRILSGTANHPVWVDGDGWKRLDALRYGDILDACKAKSYPSTASPSGGIQIQRMGLIGSTSRHTLGIEGVALDGFMKRFGRPQTARFLQNTTSITAITIRSTMNWTIWTAFQQPSTVRFMAMNGAANRNPGTKMHLLAREQRRLSGMLPTRGELGTVSTVSGHGRGDNLTRVSAINVRVSSNALPCETLTDSVATSVGANGGAPVELMTRTEYARHAAQYSELTATIKRGVAAVRVLSVSEEISVQPVYNLTVQGEHEFYANGILTHNCDAMRYLVATLDGVNQSEPGLIGTVDSLGRWVTR